MTCYRTNSAELIISRILECLKGHALCFPVCVSLFMSSVKEVSICKVDVVEKKAVAHIDCECFADLFPPPILFECRSTDGTLVSATFCSSFLSLSWEEALAVALPSWVLILSSSSSSFSRSWSKVWAQLSHSGTGQQKMTLRYHRKPRKPDFWPPHLGTAHLCLCLLAPVCSYKLGTQSNHFRITDRIQTAFLCGRALTSSPGITIIPIPVALTGLTSSSCLQRIAIITRSTAEGNKNK